MISNLVFLGFVRNDNRIIGAMLVDIVKKESNMVSIASFESGIKNGVKILNVNKNIAYEKYSLYDNKGKLRKKGLNVLVQLDNGEWRVATNDCKIYKAYDWVATNGWNNRFNRDKSLINKDYISLLSGRCSDFVLSIPNETYKEEKLNQGVKTVPGYEDKTDFELIKSMIGRSYEKDIIKHINTSSSELRGKEREVKIGNITFRLEKSCFVAYRYNEYNKEFYKIRAFTDYKIKTILGIDLNIVNERYGDTGIILLSGDLYDGSSEFYFESICYANHMYNIRINIKEIAYINNIDSWIGNRDILDNKPIRKANYDGTANIEMLVFDSYSKNVMTVFGSSISDEDNNKVRFNSFINQYRSNKGNFRNNANLLFSMLLACNSGRLEDCNMINKNNMFELFSKLDSIREKCRPTSNIVEGEVLKLSDADRLDSDLYKKYYKPTKEKIDTYIVNGEKLLLLHNGFRNYNVKTLYQNERVQCNVLVNIKASDINTNNMYQSDVLYTCLNQEELRALKNKLPINKVYCNAKLSNYAHKHDNFIVKYINYTLVINSPECSIISDGKYNLVNLNLNYLVRDTKYEDIINKYKGIKNGESIVYLIYRAVLKHNESIHRCKEQLMCNGEIEDLLDQLVIEEVIDEENDLVKVYIDSYKLEMSYSSAKDDLIKIYERYQNLNNSTSAKKLGIMQVAAGIGVLNGNIVFNKNTANKNIVVPDNVTGIIVDNDVTNELHINKLVLTKNIDIEFKKWGSLMVNNLILSDKANNMIQRFCKANNRVVYDKCKISDMNISGRTLYDLILTIAWINNYMFPNRFKAKTLPSAVGSREKNIASRIFINSGILKNELTSLLYNIHNEYELELTDKSLLSLTKYIETLTDYKKRETLTKCTDVEDVGHYIMIVGYILLSYGLNEYCCNNIISTGQSISKIKIIVRRS